MTTSEQETCRTCGGRGKVNSPTTFAYRVRRPRALRCKACDGSGFVSSPCACGHGFPSHQRGYIVAGCRARAIDAPGDKRIPAPCYCEYFRAVRVTLVDVNEKVCYGCRAEGHEHNLDLICQTCGH